MEHPENSKEYKGLTVNRGIEQPSIVNPYLTGRRLRRQRSLSAADYVEGIVKGDITVLSRAVTLVESLLPQHQAIDFYAGKQHYFRGDSVLLQDGFLRNFHLKPARIFYGTYHSPVQVLPAEQPVISWNNRKIAFLNGSHQLSKNPTAAPMKTNLLIVSKNPKTSIVTLLQHFDTDLIIFDSSNPKWKVERWKKDCDSLGIAHFSTMHQGAFVMNWQ